MFFPRSFFNLIIQHFHRLYNLLPGFHRFNDIVRMEFTGGITQPPDFVSLGNHGNILYNPHGISEVFRVGDTLYTFVANIDNSTIAMLYFPGCDNASISSSTDRDPPEIFYDSAGIYNIQLVLDEGTPQQENWCRNIVIFLYHHR